MLLRATLFLTASLASGFSHGLARRASTNLSVMMSHKTILQNSFGTALPAVAPTAKRLFLVRHGEVINPGGEKAVLYGSMDVSLSKLGEQEAQAAGAFLSQFGLSKVFSSPLSRAIYGANEVIKRQEKVTDLELTILEGFKELDRGDWCGLTKEEIGIALMSRFDACDESVTPANGESMPALKSRVMKAHRSALSLMNPGNAACIVSHLQVTRCILSEALEIPTNEMTKLNVATASVTCIDYEGDTPCVRFQSVKPDVGLIASKDRAN
ncbi:hypothetical protein MPSEU_000340100 [Mayamaea pseudoterrestris]|nr:hypothetical protein MPSEU_000340100 [Mayamaea pseudoterrestris]